MKNNKGKMNLHLQESFIFYSLFQKKMRKMRPRVLVLNHQYLKVLLIMMYAILNK